MLARTLFGHWLSTAIAATPLLPAQATANAPSPENPTPTVDRLLVCNKADHSLSIFDPTMRAEVAVVPTGEGPHEVAVSPDGRFAVVTDYGAQKPGSTLTVVDLTKNAVARTLELAWTETAADGSEAKKRLLRPHGIVFVDRDHVLVTSEATRRLALVHVGTGKIERTWATPQLTMHMVAVAPDFALAHCTSIKDGDLATFELQGDAGKADTVVKTGDGAEGLAVNPATGEVWVGNRAANTVTVFDPKTGKAVEPLDTADFPFRIAFTPNGAHALVSCAEGGDVMVFDAATKKLVKSISIAADGSELSAMPMGICVDTNGKRAYVACGRGEFVAALDLDAGKVAHKLRARPGPDGIAFANVPAGTAGGAGVTR